jgi:hypothetical protein
MASKISSHLFLIWEKRHLADSFSPTPPSLRGTLRLRGPVTDLQSEAQRDNEIHHPTWQLIGGDADANLYLLGPYTGMGLYTVLNDLETENRTALQSTCWRVGSIMWALLAENTTRHRRTQSKEIFSPQLRISELCWVVHTCNSSTWEVEAGGLRIWGQSQLHSKTLSQKAKYIYYKEN